MNKPSAHNRQDERQTSLPLRADPSNAALVGTVVVFTLLMLPGSLIVLFLALFVIYIVRAWHSRRESKVDPELAGRFRDLENSILD